MAQRVKNWGEDDDGKRFEAGKFRRYLWNSRYQYFAETLSLDSAKYVTRFDFTVRPNMRLKLTALVI